MHDCGYALRMTPEIWPVAIEPVDSPDGVPQRIQDPRLSARQLSIRTVVAPNSMAGEVRRAVRETLGTASIGSVKTLTEQVDASIVPERLIAMLAGFFGGLGALLAAVGLYGLLAYTVARRTNEIGIRMALGGTRRDVMGMVLLSGFGLACAGLAIGLPLALWSRRIATALVDDLSPAGGRPLLIATATTIVVAVAAAFVPASRAAPINPIEALRQQ